MTELERYLMDFPDDTMDYSVSVSIMNDTKDKENAYTSFMSFLMVDREILGRYTLDDVIIVLNPAKKHIDINIIGTGEKSGMKQDKTDIEIASEYDQGEVYPEDKPVLSADNSEYKDMPYLYREKTDDYIYIMKDEFVLGKSKIYSDYALDNSAISREHCIFIRSGRLTYIRDNNSTNGTYVDDTRLVPGKRVLLSDGMRINLADESFIFRSKSKY